jgi:hypothetical protein
LGCFDGPGGGFILATTTIVINLDALTQQVPAKPTDKREKSDEESDKIHRLDEIYRLAV